MMVQLYFFNRKWVFPFVKLLFFPNRIYFNATMPYYKCMVRKLKRQKKCEWIFKISRKCTKIRYACTTVIHLSWRASQIFHLSSKHLEGESFVQVKPKNWCFSCFNKTHLCRYHIVTFRESKFNKWNSIPL